MATFPIDIQSSQWFRCDVRDVARWLERPVDAPENVRPLAAAIAQSTHAIEVIAWSGPAHVAGKLVRSESNFVAVACEDASTLLLSAPVKRDQVCAAIAAQLSAGHESLALPLGGLAALSLAASSRVRGSVTSVRDQIGKELLAELVGAEMLEDGDGCQFGASLDGWEDVFSGEALQIRGRFRTEGRGEVFADSLFLGPPGRRVLALPDVTNERRMTLMRVGGSNVRATLLALLIPGADESAP